jgi:hypothetical protein
VVRADPPEGEVPADTPPASPPVTASPAASLVTAAPAGGRARAVVSVRAVTGVDDDGRVVEDGSVEGSEEMGVVVAVSPEPGSPRSANALTPTKNRVVGVSAR